jgi:hypothetical protein
MQPFKNSSENTNKINDVNTPDDGGLADMTEDLLNGPADDEDFLIVDAGMGPEWEAGVKAEEARIVSLNALRARQKQGLEDLLNMYDLAADGDVVTLVKALRNDQFINFPKAKTIRIAADQFDRVPTSCDLNRQYLFDLIFQHGKRKCPINDDFHARFVDQQYEVIDDEYDIGPWLKAFAEAGMPDESYEGIRKSMREWAKGRRKNSLTEHFLSKLPKWDGKKRAARFLINRFKCEGNKLNKMFSLAFMNQVYRRIIEPGCSAPMVPVLVGAQNAGKSYFASRLVKILMDGYDPTGRRGISAIEHDLNTDFGTLMRTVTGNSFVVMISEMTGFTTRDVDAIKAMVTREVDPLDFKYEGNRLKPRQWVMIMDSNKYEGLQRDDTGNRRFYPVFLGQGPADADGKQTWDKEFKLDMTGDYEEVWQIMAECHFYQNRYTAKRRERGLSCADDAFHKRYIRLTSDAVFAFNFDEAKHDRGTVKHRATETFFAAALHRAKKRYVVSRAGRDGNKAPNRIIVGQSALHSAVGIVSRGPVVGDAIEKKVVAMGGRKVSGKGEAVTYQWDYAPHRDSRIAEKFDKLRAETTDYDVRGAMYVSEFMTVHYGEAYKDDLEFSSGF